MGHKSCMGITLTYLFVLAMLFSKTATAQHSLPALTRQQAAEDFRWLRFALEYTHPRLYKYDDKKTADARFDSIANSIADSISPLDFLALVSKTNAAVHCGHLYTIPQGGLADAVLQKKVLPFYVKIIDSSIYILHDCSAYKIAAGSKIIAINGKSSNTIYKAMLPGIAADGYISTRKDRLIEKYLFYAFQGFDLYFQLYADRGDTFTIDYLEYGTGARKTVTVKGLPVVERKKLLLTKYGVDEQAWFKTPSPKFEINRVQDYAVLSLPRSFYDKSVDPDFDSLLAKAFYNIKQKHITNLILDLRNNEGGSEEQEMQLMAYLYNKPFKPYQNIYISHLDFTPLKPVIIERDTQNLVFNNDDEYMRRINDKLWINNYEYSDNLKLQPPKMNVFTGHLYVLMNGACFSSAANLIADIKKTRGAVFIGEESGGTFEGPTGGDDIVIQLPNSKIMVRMSPNIQIGYLYQKHPLGHGVYPTIPITYTIKDVVEGRDLEMETAKRLINNAMNKSKGRR